jgi:four helix bundle protein
MSKIITYRDLEAWQVAMDFVEHCYLVTAKFPDSERYGLTSQLRRAAVSIPTNIAEGQCRKKPRIYANHVNIAVGSHGEAETCIEIASRLRFMSPDDKKRLLRDCDSTGRLLNGLYRSIEEKFMTTRDDVTP